MKYTSKKEKSPENLYELDSPSCMRACSAEARAPAMKNLCNRNHLGLKRVLRLFLM